MVKDAYALAKADSLQWIKLITSNVSSGFTPVWTQPSRVDPNEFLPALEQRLIDQFVQSWQGDLRDTTGKLRTYKLIKEDFRREIYLTLPPYLRVPRTRLRISAHPLRIETGRYNLPAPLYRLRRESAGFVQTSQLLKTNSIFCSTAICISRKGKSILTTVKRLTVVSPTCPTSINGNLYPVQATST